MYKKRIKQWGLDKKNKENEMRAVVRKRKQLGDQGKASTFRVRGRLVDYKDVVRYWERKGVRIEDVIAQRSGSTTPDAVECFTAPPSPITTPESIAVPERILVSIRDYFKGSFESGTWLAVDPRLSCETMKAQEDTYAHLLALFRQCKIACGLFDHDRFAEGGQTLILATARVKKILIAEHSMTLTNLFALFAHMFRRRRHEIALIILRQMFALAKMLLGERHPLGCICGWLASSHLSQLEDIIVRSYRSIVDHFKNFLGPMNWSTLISRLIFFQEVDIVHDLSHKGFLLQDLLRQIEATLGPLDVRTCEVRLQLAWNFSKDQKHAEAARLGWDIAALGQRLDILGHGTYHYAEGLFIIALSQYHSGETNSAQLNLYEAIKLCESRWGLHDNRVTQWLIFLEGWLVEQGQLNSAIQVQRRWKEALQNSTDDD